MQLRSASQSPDSKINCMETPGKSSVYYWISNDSEIFLVPAEKSPFWNRYRLFDTMMFRPGEIYKSKDFFYKITIQHNGEILSLSFQRSPDPLLLSAGISVFVICINVAYAWKKRSWRKTRRNSSAAGVFVFPACTWRFSRVHLKKSRVAKQVVKSCARIRNLPAFICLIPPKISR